MDWGKQYLESASAGTLPHYSLLEIAGNLATTLSILGSLLCFLGCALSFGAMFLFAVTRNRRFLPVIFGPPLIGVGLYCLALLGGLTSLGFWSGVAVLALSYPILKRRALQRANRMVESSPREPVAKL